MKKPAAHSFDSVILREYDIRGKVGGNLGPADAFVIGCAFGTMIRRKGGSTACVGYDGRVSSPEFSGEVIAGLRAAGINVTSIGLGPTPMLYFAVKDLMADGGIMVTGSHNPGDTNGFKMMLQTGPVYGEAIQELGRMAAAGDFESGEGTLREIDVRDTYVARLLKDFTGGRDLKVAWDSGNGAAGEVLHKLVAKLPGEHVLLFDEIDGTFPNHHPDPTVDENLEDLRRAVIEQRCDLGIAFDGDADRIGVVDEHGRVIRCDMLMTLYAREVLEDHPGAPIVGDIKCSQVMFEEIARMGGKPVMWKTGHSLIKAKMAELKSPLGGELSGHIFFADKYYGFDDALYCAIRLLNEVCGGSAPLSALLEPLPRLYSTPEIRFEVNEEEKFGIVPRIIESLAQNKHEDEQIIDLDGIRVQTPDGWWLLRASNTQNVLVARAEATSLAALNGFKETLSREVGKLGYSLSFPVE